MLPLEDIYIPPISINVLDHRNFGRKPISKNFIFNLKITLNWVYFEN